MLDFFAWNKLTDKQIQWFQNNKKSIVLFPHTHRLDLLNLLVYIYDNYTLQNKILVLKNKSPLNFILNNSFCKKYINIIETPTSSEIQKGPTGFIKRALKQIKGQNEFLLFIAPNGSTHAKPWRNGYFALAKELNVPIVIIGFDYISHSIKIPINIDVNWKELNEIGQTKAIISYPDDEKPNEIIEINKDNAKQELEKILQHAMGDIVPLVPERSYIPIKQFKGVPSVMPDSQKLIYIVILLILIVIIAILIIYILRRYKYTK